MDVDLIDGDEVMRFTSTIKTNYLINQLVLFVGFLAILNLSGCGGGASTEGAPNTALPIAGVYNGPTAATPDVQKFQDTVWKGLRATNRCGTCHTAGGQSPSFADSNDVNFAYSEALKVIKGYLVADLATPANSLMVTKVGLGHQCWLGKDTNSLNICAAEIEQFISDWAATPETTEKEIVLSAPTIRDVSTSKNFPAFADATNNFATTVYPVLHDTDKGNCVRCHAESSSNKQQPYFAQDNVEAAYEAAKQKINLATPSQSRFVLRMCDLDQTNDPRLCEAHNCWSGDCEDDALTIKTAIEAFSGNISAIEVDEELVISKAMKLTDGIIAAGGKRHETNIVALWQFKSGSGNVAFDTSGISPAMNLSFDPNYVEWVGGYGIEIKDGGRAQALTSDSKKLHDTIKASGQFSIEAWIVPNNVAQQDKNIISYSASNTLRNFTVKQNEYNYESHLRTSETNTDGAPALTTDPDDQDAQATQQHIVINYDPANGGRGIFVNGVDTGDSDTTPVGNLSDWKDNYAFVLGNEAGAAVSDLTKQWSGKFRLVAIHNRALTQEQITQNFEAGVGEKFFLLFSVSHLTNVPESYILLEVAQFDSYSYLFNKPTFVSLAANPGTIDIDIKGMRIGINGQEALVGQTFIKLDTNNISSSGQVLSSMGTVIAQDQGVANDDFFLSFEQFGSNSKVYLPAVTPAPAVPVDLDPVSAVGLRTFEKLNASMSELTGVPTTMGTIPVTFDKLKQQLPTAETIDTFVSAHVVGIAQLAFEYCDQLVEDTTLRNAFFGAAPYNFAGFTDPLATAFGTFAQKEAVVNALYDRMIGIPVTELDDATVLTNAPTRSQIMWELIEPTNSPGADPLEPENLFARLERSCGTGGPTAGEVDCADTNGEGTQEFVKAMCASVLGSATLLMQ